MSSVWSNISTWFQEKAGELAVYTTREATSQGPIPTPVASTPSQPDSSESGDEDLLDSSEDEALFDPPPQARANMDTNEEMFQKYSQLPDVPLPRRRGRVKFQDHRQSSSPPITLQPKSDSPFAEAPNPDQTQVGPPPDLAPYLVNKGQPLHVNAAQTPDPAPAFENHGANYPTSPGFGMDSRPLQPHRGAWSKPAEPSGFPASNPGHFETVAPPAQAQGDMSFLSPLDSRGELANQEVYLKRSLTPHPSLPADVDFRSPDVNHLASERWDSPWPQIPKGDPVSLFPLHRLPTHREPQGTGLPSQRSGGVSKAYNSHSPAEPPTFISGPPPTVNRYTTQHPEANNSMEPSSRYPFLRPAQDARPLGVRRREKEPAKYEGRSDLVDYLHHFSKIAKRNQWTYEVCGLELATSLQGEAREVLRFLPLDKEDDCNAIIQALSTRFDPEGRESRYSAELMERVCQPKEDVATYGHQLQRLAKKAYPGSQLPERVLVDLFIRGLPSDDMKRHVSSFEPPSYAEAVRRATVYEAYSPKTRKPKPDMLIAPIGNPQKSGPGPRIPPLMSTPPRPPEPQTVNPQGYSMPPAGWGPPMGNPSPQPSFPGQPPARPRRPRSETT